MFGSKSKPEIRNACREASKRITKEYREEASRKIEESVLAHPWYRAAETVFVFVGVAGEPDTRGILSQALREGKRVCVPRCGKRPRMDAVPIRGLDELRPGMLGIPEPGASAPAVDPEDVDLALIPCVAAGKDGSRLGHGAGYYDAFLRGRKTRKICLCFEKTLTDGVPMDGRDVWMDQIMTESGIYPGKEDAI